jgi:ribosome biogenesis GTPase A
MNENKTNINWYPGHMAKTKREIQEKLNLIDVVFEVIDARIPYSSKNREIDSMMMNKPRILVMTKTDLCDRDVTLQWKKYYEDMGYHVVMVDLLHDKNLNGILDLTKSYSMDMNQKRREKGLKARKLRILIVGIPNVGKSTLINRLVGKKATNVGNKPGITKSLEWIRINDSMELLDTPGILWPKLEQEKVALNLASMTAIKEEILNKESVTSYIVRILLDYYRDSLDKRYSIGNVNDIVGIFDLIGKKIGAIRNGEVDYDKVYTIIIKDLREGLLGKVTFDRYEDR